MQVKYTTGKTTKKFQDQEFFDYFNWNNFEQGDIVWLEDYHAKDVDRICGIFIASDNEVVTVRLVKNVHGFMLAGAMGLESILTLRSPFWQNTYL